MWLSAKLGNRRKARSRQGGSKRKSYNRTPGRSAHSDSQTIKSVCPSGRSITGHPNSLSHCSTVTSHGRLSSKPNSKGIENPNRSSWRSLSLLIFCLFLESIPRAPLEKTSLRSHVRKCLSTNGLRL